MKVPVILLFLAVATVAVAQEEPRTIHFRRDDILSKAVFDNTQLRLMVIDRYGNPRENEVTSYTLHVKAAGGTHAFEGFGNALTAEMINFLKKQRKASKLFFTGITAREDNGHIVKLPDVIETWFPDCQGCEKGGRRR